MSDAMPNDAGWTAQTPATALLPSILFRNKADRPSERCGAPEYFADLNLDQIIAAITAGRDEYDLRPFLYAPLHDLDAVAFRHEVFRDLESRGLFDGIKRFALGMQRVREHLSQSGKVRHRLQKERWFFEAVRGYCRTVGNLSEALAAAELRSRGFLAFKEYIEGYCASTPFASLLRQGDELAGEIAAAQYAILIQGPRVDVRLHEGEPDYSADVLATFARFKQGNAQPHTFDFSEPADVNHIEAQILDRVALLYAGTFAKLAQYCEANKEFQDDVITTFDREVQFYVSYIEYMTRFKQLDLSFCYPHLTETRGEIFNYAGFDLGLAGSLLTQNRAPVCNDFHLTGPERIVVVSGPNQGGKTTFARIFGQLHHLASLGCPVPGTRAQLCLFDRLFAHFERAENIGNLRGKLQDDLVRIHRILEAATPRSVIVMNEIFSSTTLRDALALSRKVAATLIDLDLYCVWVTFIDELSSLGEQTVSMVSTVVPDNPAERTYKIVRRPADGLAYALSVAEKYRLTYDAIKQRIGG
jgi:DNA mismatch repair protein MutS